MSGTSQGALEGWITRRFRKRVKEIAKSTKQLGDKE